MTEPTKINKSNLWNRLYKIGLTLIFIVSIFYSYTVEQDLKSFKKAIGPIGTNPPQYTPTKFYTAELGTEHLYPPVNFLTDTIVGHNYLNNMFTRLGTVNDIRSGLATTASLSSYVTNSSLTTTLGGYVPTTRNITINGIAFDLSANRSWTTPNTTYTAGFGLDLTGTVFSLSARTVNNAPGRSIVTTAAAANGFQVSSIKEADISYSVSINTSVSLSGNSSGYVVLEICPTNSATAGDWIEVSRVSSGQSGTLVIGLTLNQLAGAPISATKVTPGYYARIRSVNLAGTPTYALTSQREVY